MKIGYAKVGRSIDLNPESWGTVGGENEPPILLRTLAERHPEHTFYIVGATQGESDLPTNVINKWTEWQPQFRDIGREYSKTKDQAAYDEASFAVVADTFAEMDQFVIWVGSHGSNCSGIPTTTGADKGRPAGALDSDLKYVAPIIHGINHWRDTDPANRWETYLCPDVRNIIKCRDIKWPIAPVLGQFALTKSMDHFRFGGKTSPDGPPWDEHHARWRHGHSYWHAEHDYVYSQLEIVGMNPDASFSNEFTGRDDFGIIINEARTYVKHDRLTAMKDYVMPLSPAWIHGKWSEHAQTVLGREIHPLHWSQIWDKMKTVKCTLTTPSSGSGWATTKPWEAFAVGTVCFFHPEYDTQGNIIPLEDDGTEAGFLASWLRVKSPAELKDRVERVCRNDYGVWHALINAQHNLYERAMSEQRCVKMIEERWEM